MRVAQQSFAQEKTINFSELETTIKEELKATNIPGAAVAVVIGDRVVFVKGFGVSNIETGAPVNPDTLFRIASTTKMLTATAAVTLSEQGKLRLDVPIGKYLPGLSRKLAAVTMHQLLSHTAGIRDGASFSGPRDDEALAQFVRSWTDFRRRAAGPSPLPRAVTSLAVANVDLATGRRIPRSGRRV